MSKAARHPTDWQPSLAPQSDHPSDPGALRLRWRLLTRPARSLSEAAALRIHWATRAAQTNAPQRRWRPMSAPSNPVPPWRWPGSARAERASRRAAISERWRPLTAR